MSTKDANQDKKLEKADLTEVIKQLKVDPKTGLSAAEVSKRREKYGANELTTKEKSFASQVLHAFMGPISYMIELAAIVSAIIGHWDDFIIILVLLLFNVTIEVWQNHKASSALAALKKGLAPQAIVLRDGKFQNIPARELVPGDIIKIRLGMVVPADVRLIDGEYASIDQAALTGESLPVTKKVGDGAYSGSIVKQGEMLGVVIATGSNTFFGRTAKLVASAGSVGHAQKAMFQIGNFLIVVAVILAAIMVACQVYRDIVVTDTWGLKSALNILEFVLVLLVASIPVAMPTVFSVTLALGAVNLSKQKAIVSKLSSIEEMAGIDILCSDKTGTLTKNQLTLGKATLINAADDQDCIFTGALASQRENHDAIDDAIIAAVKNPADLHKWHVDKFIPFDPVTKRTETHAHNDQGEVLYASKGAPQVIIDLAKPSAAETAKIQQAVADLANHGYRALAVAKSTDQGKTWQVLGILSMFDPPRDDSKKTIKNALDNKINVKMITGDDTAIAIETARQLGMGTKILNAADVFPENFDPDHVPERIVNIIEEADGFARVFPEHKYAIVKALQQKGHIVAMTGDGVNDAPALKQADCGTAVQGATEAARSAAALILTAPGLSVITTAIKEARKIFKRITAYTIYRVALTMTIMFLVVLSSIIFKFQPLTAVAIVMMSLLDDLPIMSIAYDNTAVGTKPMRWRMSHVLTTSTILGIFSVIQSMLILSVGYSLVNHHDTFGWLDMVNQSQLQTIMFIQIVSAGCLMLFVCRAEKWFFERPFPAKILLLATCSTQIITILMCFFGWLVPAISLETIAFVWGYNIIWMFIMNIIKLTVDRHLNKD
ncbi:plasma-membrane proton-efflux P-type ATPase [Limosilactobacillus antri]|nr:plasma-membrane proton-efflux P-type ATPase [Limosilactobacillus antri]EEW52728.1 plasma-membrane proton-efflux P-type ATPase [Limosilactobacillus antri DSM 16041]